MHDRIGDRVARNEAAFRSAVARANESLLHRPVVCECGADDCAAIVLLTPDEYDAVRAAVTCFIVAPAHEGSLVVVRREPQYVVVEQTGVRGEGHVPAR